MEINHDKESLPGLIKKKSYFLGKSLLLRQNDKDRPNVPSGPETGCSLVIFNGLTGTILDVEIQRESEEQRYKHHEVKTERPRPDPASLPNIP